jgi:hypothetical protein
MLAVLIEGVGAGEFMATAHRGRGIEGADPLEAIVRKERCLVGRRLSCLEGGDIKMARRAVEFDGRSTSESPSCCRRLPFSGPSRPTPSPGKSSDCLSRLLLVYTSVDFSLLFEEETVLFSIFRLLDFCS